MLGWVPSAISFCVCTEFSSDNVCNLNLFCTELFFCCTFSLNRLLNKIKIPFNLTITDISSGSNHVVCAYKDDDSSVSIIDFGDNTFLQCNEKRPENNEIYDLRSGWSHNGIDTTSGCVYLWRQNTYEQLAYSQGDKWDDLFELKGVQMAMRQIH